MLFSNVSYLLISTVTDIRLKKSFKDVNFYIFIFQYLPYLGLTFDISLLFVFINFSENL